MGPLSCHIVIPSNKMISLKLLCGLNVYIYCFATCLMWYFAMGSCGNVIWWSDLIYWWLSWSGCWGSRLFWVILLLQLIHFLVVKRLDFIIFPLFENSIFQVWCSYVLRSNSRCLCTYLIFCKRLLTNIALDFKKIINSTLLSFYGFHLAKDKIYPPRNWSHTCFSTMQNTFLVRMVV